LPSQLQFSGVEPGFAGSGAKLAHEDDVARFLDYLELEMDGSPVGIADEALVPSAAADPHAGAGVLAL
jgi:hypothetical protein